MLWHHGSSVPAHLGVRLRSPLGTRVLATRSGKNSWNLLSIQRGSSAEYDLGGEFSVLLLQELDFNIVVGVDILFVHGVNNKFEHPVLNITCWGTLYSTFGLVDLKRRTAELAWTAFARLWIRTFGAPQYTLSTTREMSLWAHGFKRDLNNMEFALW